MSTTVSILAEIPETLHESLKTFLENRPDWDQDRVFAAALSLFLLQNQSNHSLPEKSQQRQTVRVYLDTLFKYPVVNSLGNG